MQKRLVGAAAAARRNDQILRERVPAPGLQLIKADDTSQHPIDRPRRQPRGLISDHDDVVRRPARPRCELGELDDTDLLPAQRVLVKERPERPQIVGVSLTVFGERSLLVNQPGYSSTISTGRRSGPMTVNDSAARVGKNTRRTT